MNLVLRFRVIHGRNYAMSMEMSFFISCPISNALPGPDPVPVSGRGTLRPPDKGHETKKTSLHTPFHIQFLRSINYLQLIPFGG
jgi:hypothetical protein